MGPIFSQKWLKRALLLSSGAHLEGTLGGKMEPMYGRFQVRIKEDSVIMTVIVKLFSHVQNEF